MPEHAAVRTRTAPIHPRRVSGPSRRLAPAAPIPRGHTGVFERISRFPDHFVVDRVLRSRGVIWLIGLLLGGIVAMQVSLLRLNSGISRAVQTQQTLEKQNMGLQSSIAELTSSDRVTAGAAGGQMVDPPAGQTRYLEARPATDPARAARRYKPPSERAQAIMANNGMLPGAMAEPGSAAAQLAASLNASTAAAGATPPVATATPQADTSTTPQAGTTTPQATATPPATTAQVPTATAVPTTTPSVTTDPATGAATSPVG
ncbi:hypothetical protein [Solirubrobacter soli]|uniref:hypothetical protein n=1 Tax=Solirubrobacter soli TaxID=363832 RepID=UPI000425EF9C|nr:hypothetical protein [Solirubrobacter soli]